MSHRLKLLLTGYAVCCGANAWFVPSPALGAAVREQDTGYIAQVSGSSAEPLELSDRLVAQTPQPTQPAKSATDPFLLKPGSRGADVLRMQTILQQMGYSLTPDGIFGEKTKQAVAEFQKKFGLSVDSRVGAETWQQLQNVEAQLASRDFQANTFLQAQATTTDDSAATGAAPNIAPGAATEAAPPPSDQLGWLRWLLGLISVGALLWVIYYVIKRPGTNRIKSSHRQKWAPEQPEKEKPAEFRESEIAEPKSISQTSSYASLMEESEPEPSSSSQMVPQKPSFQESTTPSSLSFQLDKDTEMTRLSKVNIVEELITDLHSLDPVKRRKAVWDLGQRGDSRAVQPLVDLMVDADSHQRSLILAAISEIGIRTLKPMNRALIVSLQDESADVRKNAIRDVTRIYDLMSQISQVLRHASEDPDTEVRETARWAISQLNRVRGMAEFDDQPSFTGSSATPDSLPSDASSHSDGNESTYKPLF